MQEKQSHHLNNVNDNNCNCRIKVHIYRRLHTRIQDTVIAIEDGQFDNTLTGLPTISYQTNL